MKSLPSSLACAIAAVLMAAAMPAYSNGSNCLFRVSGTVGLAFGTLDPSVGGPKSVTGSVEVGDCNAVQLMAISIDQGQRGNRTMIRDLGTETIAYSIGAVTFAGGNAGPGNNNFKVASFMGTVQASAYLGAVAGTYRDRLILTLTP
ncbi:spore coat protein U domain-containing protein [Caenimonas soli]|uniref:spore coat protein U domain-containing protein n=1 Tax=Caenimonas soli TaxID=2735555 RepID=UPI00155371F9|nr:spore coat protein U domain-containing protein [Caenimonas soli]NPC58065.1 fimbrial major subunit CsuA/B family protein [Caenimonas soli]